MKWSDRQLAIFDAYENTRKNIAIEATAGNSRQQQDNLHSGVLQKDTT